VWDHLGAILGRGAEDAMVSDEMAAREGNQRDQLLYQLVRREHDMGRAISPNLLETKGETGVRQFL
jgi:hemerythrin-like domain-containing protein